MDVDVTKRQQYAVEFRGKGGEFFKIWIVNILLTIVTLYIYSAWAKIRTKRYFYGNTVIDGSSFEYHAKPLQILLSRMVAVLLFAAVTVGGLLYPFVPVIATAVLFLIIPWAIWRSTRFNMRMTSYRNVRFNFTGKLWPMYLYQMIIPLFAYGLPIVALGAASYRNSGAGVFATIIVVSLVVNFFVVAFTHQRLANYFLNGYQYGKSQFSGNVKLPHFIGTYLLAGLLALGPLVLYGIVLFLPLLGTTSIEDLLLAILHEMENSLIGIGLLYLYFLSVGLVVVALIRARVRNYVFANASLDTRVTFKSTMKTFGLWWVLFSNLLLVVITIGFGRPWAQVRLARYIANQTHVISEDSLENFVGEKREQVGAFGDELGDAFDMDMDVGF